MRSTGSTWQRPTTESFRQRAGAKAAPSTDPHNRRLYGDTGLQRCWQRWSREQSHVTTAVVAEAPPLAMGSPRTHPDMGEPLPLSHTLQRADSWDHSRALSLDNIRQSLIRQEDTIIFSLIERAQFQHNSPVYRSGAIPVPGYRPDGRQHSLLEWLLWETEQTHGRIRRYTSPDEQAFFPNDLPPLVLPPMEYPKVLAPCAKDININPRIMSMYVDHVLPDITEAGSDNNYGSSAMYDVLALQALSKRIHYGKFVAEAKFLAQREEYSALICKGDAQGLMRLLTNEEVENQVVERVRQKAAIFGQEIGDGDHSEPSAPPPRPSLSDFGDGVGWDAPLSSYKVEPDKVAELFRRWVMPLTKEVQIQYLLRRLDHSRGSSEGEHALRSMFGAHHYRG